LRSTRRGRAKPPASAGASTRSCRCASSRWPACSPRDEAIARIKQSIQKSYDKKGDEIVRRNFAAVDQALQHLHEVPVAGYASTATGGARRAVPTEAPEFVQRVTAAMLAGKGELLPVSAFPPDGTWPTGTALGEARIASTGDSGVGCRRSASSATSAH
jgi:hypothetical protein